MSRYIAILKIHDDYNEYDYHTNHIIDSISNWDEVSDEDFNILKSAQGTNSFIVIERMMGELFIKKTVSEYKEMVLKQEEARKKYQEKYQAKLLKQKEKKKQTSIEKKKKLFEKLKKELE